MFWKALHEHPAEHGLPAADLSRYLDDPFVLQDGVQEGIQGRTPISTVKEEVGVRSDPERRLVESEMF